MKRLLVKISPVVLLFMISCGTFSLFRKTTKPFVLILQPGSHEGKDAFIEDYPYDDYRNRNWGKSDEFAAISWTAGGTPFVVRSFIDFNFDTIPDNATIDSAKLSLYAYGNNGHGVGHDTLGGANECYLYRIIEEWEEDLITWNTQPNVTEINKVLIPRSDSTMQDFVGIDITNLVRDIIEYKENSYGFMLRLEIESDYRRMFFATSDVQEEQKRPKLEIYYKVGNE